MAATWPEAQKYFENYLKLAPDRSDGRAGQGHPRLHQAEGVSTDALDSGLAGRLAAVRQRIASAAIRSGRPPEAVRLVAVSKTFGADAVRAAHAAGQVDFGENRVQEALGKRADTADLPTPLAPDRPPPVQQGQQGPRGLRRRPVGAQPRPARAAVARRRRRRRRPAGPRSRSTWPTKRPSPASTRPSCVPCSRAPASSRASVSRG